MMNSYELAIDEEGEPFQVPPQVAGWRVRRASDGRGRPSLVHSQGKPLVVRVNASHSELLAAAGPGRYRLEAVDEGWHKVEGVPTACTGPLTTDDDGRDDDSSDEPFAAPSLRKVSSVEDMLCQVVSANTRIVEKAISQMSAVMTGVAEVLNAAHNAGITSRPPPPAPAPPPVPSDDDQTDEAASSFGMSQVFEILIKEAIDKALPLIIGRLANGGGLGGIPLEALIDWRKAAPNPAATAAPPPARPAPAPSWPESAAAAPSAAAPTSAPAGAAPGHEPPPGAAPAEGPSHAAPPPPSQESAAAIVNAHVLQVWQGLSPPERSRATQLVTRLTPAERAAWLAELATLSVPEAIARARHAIHGQPPSTPPIPPLPIPAPGGADGS